MTIVTSRLSVSVDGFAAGPNQSVEDPFGEGGMALSNWMLETDQPGRAADAAVLQEANDGVGSHIMGRKMFGGGDGPWDETWTGWWGEEPPYHAPVFVLTRHPRDPLPMKGGTTFNFVTDGIESALDQARKAAGDKKVAIAGGAGTVNQYLAAGLLDEFCLHVVPITLGVGERVFEGVGALTLEPVRVVASPTVTHLKYRIVR
ncbi:MAG TPA: dihydrofolate reductase family protein [Actinomycetes bacterium]|nr:dihydrofolate reductase family protein [Actinomycetes bacterium]